MLDVGQHWLRPDGVILRVVRMAAVEEPTHPSEWADLRFTHPDGRLGATLRVALLGGHLPWPARQLHDERSLATGPLLESRSLPAATALAKLRTWMRGSCATADDLAGVDRTLTATVERLLDVERTLAMRTLADAELNTALAALDLPPMIASALRDWAGGFTPCAIRHDSASWPT